MTVETRNWKGEEHRGVVKTDDFLYNTEQFLTQTTDSGWIVWYEAGCYDAAKRFAFDGFDFYGTIYITKKDAEGHFTTFE